MKEPQPPWRRCFTCSGAAAGRPHWKSASKRHTPGTRAPTSLSCVRQELPLTRHDRTGLYGHLVVGLLTSRNGGIYSDDHEALEALNLVAEALGQSLTVQIIERS